MPPPCPIVRDCWHRKPRHKVLGHQVQDLQGRGTHESSSMRPVSHGLRTTPCFRQGEKFWQPALSSGSPFPAHTSCRSGLSLSPCPGPAIHRALPRAPCSPQMPRSPRRSLLLDQVFPWQPLSSPALSTALCCASALQEKALGWWLSWITPELLSKVTHA